MEKRQYVRTSIDLPVTFTLKGKAEYVNGVGKDISLGGIRIETSVAVPFRAEIVIRASLRTSSGAMREFDLPGVVRWVGPGVMGVQFGNLGAHETHAITEMGRAS